MDNVVVGFVGAVGELVLAQIFPDDLGGIELRRVGRQDDRRDVFWHGKVLAVMPARAIEDKRGMRVRGYGFGDELRSKAACARFEADRAARRCPLRYSGEPSRAKSAGPCRRSGRRRHAARRPGPEPEPTAAAIGSHRERAQPCAAVPPPKFRTRDFDGHRPYPQSESSTSRNHSAAAVGGEGVERKQRVLT